MIEIRGDLWTTPASWICITTNGIIKANGEAVMGAGIAAQAVARMPDLPKLLGVHLKLHGNHVGILTTWNHKVIVAFPTKHDWRQNSPLSLIERSAHELAYLVETTGVAGDVVLPPPGCGNGQRDYVTEVRPILLKYLDDRFKVVNNR